MRGLDPELERTEGGGRRGWAQAWPLGSERLQPSALRGPQWFPIHFVFTLESSRILSQPFSRQRGGGSWVKSLLGIWDE